MHRIKPAARATFLGAGILVGCGGQQQPPEDLSPTPNAQSAVQTDQEATEPVKAVDDQDVKLQVLDFDAIQRLLSQHKGKIVVMDVWATHCEPCIKEFPRLVAIHQRYGPEKVACVSVSSDFLGLPGKEPEDHRENVLAFLKRQEATFDNVLSSTPDADLYEKLAFGSIPAVFVYGRDGQLVKQFGGGPDAAFTYENDVAPLVEQLVQEQ